MGRRQDKTMCTFSAYAAFNKVTGGQTDIKHDKAETRSSMSLSMDRVEMLPPSRRSSFNYKTAMKTDSRKLN